MCGKISQRTLFGVAFLCLLATASYIIALSTPFMITRTTHFGVITDNSVTNRYGWFKYCQKNDGDAVGHDETCKNYEADKCDLLPPHNAQDSGNCDKFRTVKSLGVAATAICGASTFVMCVLALMTTCRSVPYIFAFMGITVSAAAGIVASSMYIELAKYDVENNGFKYDYSMGFFLAGWILNSLTTLIGCFTGAAYGSL